MMLPVITAMKLKIFPKAPEDIMRFMELATPEWRNLVQDMMVFLEWKDRERVPLQDDLRRFYDITYKKWLIYNLVFGALWNGVQREYRKLVTDGQRFFALPRSNISA